MLLVVLAKVVLLAVLLVCWQEGVMEEIDALDCHLKPKGMPMKVSSPLTSRSCMCQVDHD